MFEVIASAYEYEDGAQCSSLHDWKIVLLFLSGARPSTETKMQQRMAISLRVFKRITADSLLLRKMMELVTGLNKK